MALNPETEQKRRALAALLQVQPEHLLPCDERGHVWKHLATEYAVWPDPVQSPNLLLIGEHSGWFCYRCR